jgi:hypothetical protein
VRKVGSQNIDPPPLRGFMSNRNRLTERRPTVTGRQGHNEPGFVLEAKINQTGLPLFAASPNRHAFGRPARVGDLLGLLFVMQSAPGAFVGQPGASQQPPSLFEGAGQAKDLLHLGGDLGCIPGALTFFYPLAHLCQNIGRDCGGLP